MDTLSRNSNNGEIPAEAGKRPQADKRWTILFIGNHGRTITLKRFKGLVLLTGLVLFVSLAVAAGLLYYTISLRQEKLRLGSDLQDLKAQFKALRHEKDILMTKLVLAQSRATGPAPGIAQKEIAQKEIAGNCGSQG